VLLPAGEDPNSAAKREAGRGSFALGNKIPSGRVRKTSSGSGQVRNQITKRSFISSVMERKIN
jgi:hypothetical protein